MQRNRELPMMNKRLTSDYGLRFLPCLPRSLFLRNFWQSHLSLAMRNEDSLVSVLNSSKLMSFLKHFNHVVDMYANGDWGAKIKQNAIHLDD